MIARVPRILTSMPWQEIAGLHPRQVHEYQLNSYECVEGLLVDDGPKPLGAARKQTIPFRFYMPYGANLNVLAGRVWRLVNANQSLMDVLLTP